MEVRRRPFADKPRCSTTLVAWWLACQGFAILSGVIYRSSCLTQVWRGADASAFFFFLLGHLPPFTRPPTTLPSIALALGVNSLIASRPNFRARTPASENDGLRPGNACISAAGVTDLTPRFTHHASTSCWFVLCMDATVLSESYNAVGGLIANATVPVGSSPATRCRVVLPRFVSTGNFAFTAQASVCATIVRTVVAAAINTICLVSFTFGGESNGLSTVFNFLLITIQSIQ